jgi:hypothetical protein
MRRAPLEYCRRDTLALVELLAEGAAAGRALRAPREALQSLEARLGDRSTSG